MIQVYKKCKPEVSVILPAFNRAELLVRAIHSVLKQNFQDLELIIVDDGSSDNTRIVIEPFNTRHSNIRYMYHSNRGVTLSMNAGIQISAGKYITFLGSDDEYKPDHIELRMSFMQENPGVDLIHGGTEIIGDEYVYDKNDLSKKIHLSECIIGGTLFGRRTVFEEVGGFRNLPYSGESDLYERCKDLFTVMKVDFPTYVYHRESQNSITKNIHDIRR